MATTDFFENQDRARQRTALLVFLFILAVLAVIAGAYVVVTGVWVYYANDEGALGGEAAPWSQQIWNPKLLAIVAGGTVLVVATGSLYKWVQLRSGGARVAEMLGGRPIDHDSATPQQRQLLNIVHEMAIASGVPAPPVYVMANEHGINAFAAGYEPGDAVIGVTEGAIEQLDRDQMQGVIAHEFSHILNGDMRTNIRLIGVLHGILIIGILGYITFRMGLGASIGRHRHHVAGSSDRKKGGGMPLIAAGLGLMAVGFLGKLFGDMIKAAVSRQREFLADASAVQFTRHPAGLAGALKRIGGYADGTEVQNNHASEVSHMFFGRAMASKFGGLMSTHPPVDARIRRIEPNWEGGEQSESAQGEAEAAGAMGFAGGGGASNAAQAPAAETGGATQGGAVAHVGQPTEAHLRYARQMLESMPKSLRFAAGGGFGARAVVYALLLDDDKQARAGQLTRLDEHADAEVAKLTRHLAEDAHALDRAARLPLLDAAMPALRELSDPQYDAFEQNIDALIRADDKVDLFEWTLQRVILRHLQPHFRDEKPTRTRYRSLAKVRGSLEAVLSALAHVGQKDDDAAAAAFERGVEQLNVQGLSMRAQSDASLQALSAALDELNALRPRLKRPVLEAAAACITADKEVTAYECELLRAVADTLDCPMPPLLPGQPLT